MVKVRHKSADNEISKDMFYCVLISMVGVIHICADNSNYMSHVWLHHEQSVCRQANNR